MLPRVKKERKNIRYFLCLKFKKMMNNVEIPMLLLNAAIFSLRETTKEWILYIYTQMFLFKENCLNYVLCSFFSTQFA